METQTFTIPNITCGHCVMTIKNELLELDGVAAGGDGNVDQLLGQRLAGVKCRDATKRDRARAARSAASAREPPIEPFSCKW